MNKITQFGKPTLVLLRTDIDAALAAVAERYGITLKAGRCTYTANTFTMKVEGAIVSDDGKPASREAEVFKVNARIYGFEPDDLGRSFILAGRPAQIVGMNPRASKMPIIVEVAGERKKAGAEYVLLALRGNIGARD